MDSILASLVTAMMDGSRDKKERSPHLPTAIKEIWISKSMSNEPGHKFQCYSHAKSKSFKQNEADILVWDPAIGRTVLRLSRLQTKLLQTSNSGGEDTTKHPCYFVEWQPPMELFTKGSPVFQKMLPTLSDPAAQRAYL
jgi:hypothetical protein